EPHFVLEVVRVREQGRQHQPDAALLEGIVRALHEAHQVAGLGRAGREVAAAARGRDVLIMESVGMERGVLGAEQVHQAEGDKGGPAEPRLERRRRRLTGQAVQEHGVGQAGVLCDGVRHRPPFRSFGDVRAGCKIACFRGERRAVPHHSSPLQEQGAGGQGAGGQNNQLPAPCSLLVTGARSPVPSTRRETARRGRWSVRGATYSGTPSSLYSLRLCSPSVRLLEYDTTSTMSAGGPYSRAAVSRSRCGSRIT